MMQSQAIHRKKIKRILLYYRELERLKLSHQGALALMTYVFNLTDRWIEELLRTHNLNDYQDVELEFVDIDMKVIDAYVEKIHKQRKSDRKQMKLF